MMDIFIASVLLFLATACASSLDDKQALLIRYIDRGDLEQVKALLRPPQIEMFYDSENSSDESPPVKKRKLLIEPHPANLFNNEALITASDCDRADIVEYLLTFPEVLETAKSSPEEALKLATRAAIHGFDDLALEYSKFCTIEGLWQLFSEIFYGNRIQFLERLLWDERLDMSRCAGYLLVAVTRPNFHTFHLTTLSFEHRQKLAAILACHERLPPANYASLLNWAIEYKIPEIFALTFKNSDLITRNECFKQTSWYSDRDLYRSIALAHPEAILPEYMEEKTRSIVDLMSSLKCLTMEECTENSGNLIVQNKAEYMALVCRACYDGEIEKLNFLIDLNPQFKLDNEAGDFSELFIVMTVLDRPDAAVQTLKHFSKFWSREFVSLNFAASYLSKQKETIILEFVFDRLCNSLPYIAKKRHALDEYLSACIEPSSIQSTFDTLTAAYNDETFTDLEGCPALMKMLRYYFSWCALRLRLNEIDQFMPLEIYQYIFRQMLEELA